MALETRTWLCRWCGLQSETPDTCSWCRHALQEDVARGALRITVAGTHASPKRGQTIPAPRPAQPAVGPAPARPGGPPETPAAPGVPAPGLPQTAPHVQPWTDEPPDGPPAVPAVLSPVPRTRVGRDAKPLPAPEQPLPDLVSPRVR